MRLHDPLGVRPNSVLISARTGGCSEFTGRCHKSSRENLVMLACDAKCRRVPLESELKHQRFPEWSWRSFRRNWRNFRRSLEGDFRASFAGENRQKHFPPKLHCRFHHQTSLRSSGLWRALKIITGSLVTLENLFFPKLPLPS